MKTLSLALRNILRNKRRTLLALSAIITGVAGIIIFGGFIEFTFQGLRESTIRTQLGHVQIYQRGYIEHGVANPAKYLIKEPAKVEKVLREMPEVLTVTRRLTMSGLISNGNKTLTAKVTGVVPDQEEEFAAFETMLDGRQLDGDIPHGGVIGVELAKALDAEVGDYLIILTNTIAGAINAVEFELAGIAQTGSQEYDSVFVKLPIDMVQQALETQAVEKIVVLLDKTEQLDRVLTALPEVLNETDLALEYRSWKSMAPFYHKVVAMYRGLFNVIQAIIAVIVLFSIVNTMSMAVFERTREIGTLRAMGTTQAGIMKLFMVEGVLMGVIGGILGIFFGAMIAIAINLGGGIDIPPPPGMSRGYISLILIVPSVLIYAFLLTVSVSVLSGFVPAWKASRVKVVDALAYV